MSTEKKCPRCGNAVPCSHDKNCFCMKYKMTPELLEHFAKTYAGCLCEECLKDFLKEGVSAANYVQRPTKE